jgi:hypothetical protein
MHQVSYYKYKEFNYVKQIPLSFIAYECISPIWTKFCKSNSQYEDGRNPPKRLLVPHGIATLKPCIAYYKSYFIKV